MCTNPEGGSLSWKASCVSSEVCRRKLWENAVSLLRRVTGDSICFHFYTNENKLGQTVLGKEILPGPYKNLSLLFRGGRMGKPIIKESLNNWENCQGNSEKAHYSVPGVFQVTSVVAILFSPLPNVHFF